MCARLGYDSPIMKILCIAGSLRAASYINRPEVMIANAAKRFDASGTLVDEDSRTRIRPLPESLVSWTRQLSPQH